jgi:hypothetical protein
MLSSRSPRSAGSGHENSLSMIATFSICCRADHSGGSVQAILLLLMFKNSRYSIFTNDPDTVQPRLLFPSSIAVISCDVGVVWAGSNVQYIPCRSLFLSKSIVESHIGFGSHISNRLSF